MTCLMECLGFPLLFSNGGLSVRAVVEVNFAGSCMVMTATLTAHEGQPWLKVLKGSPSMFNFLVFLGVMVNLMLSTMLI